MTPPITQQGQLKMLVSSDGESVRLEFGDAAKWDEGHILVTMPKPQALTFAFSVLEHCGVKIEHKLQQDPAPGEPA